MPPQAHGGSTQYTLFSTSEPAGRPLIGVFETLADQHREVLELMRDAGSVQGLSQRRERWDEARRRLLSHERAESEVVYGALAALESAQPFLSQHAQQAEELESAVAELDSTSAGSEQWIERLRDVMAMLDDHVRDEEEDFFPRAQRLLGENAARELDEPFKSRQRDVLHALAGNA